MHTPLRTRFSATLLLLLFVGMGGGLGVSGVDVLLYHWDQGPEVAQVHIEQAGADCHAESCFLGYAVSDGRFLTAARQQPTVRSVDGTASKSEFQVTSAPPLQQASPLPRAPPRLFR